MSQSVVIATLAGLGGMFGWGLADFFAKKTIDEIGDVTSLALAHLTGAVAFAVVVGARMLAQGGLAALQFSAPAWLEVVGFGALQALIYILVYRGFSKGQLSLLNPVFASFSGLAALISIVAFGEAVTGHVLFALCIVFGGVLLINLDVRELRHWRLGFTSIAGLPEILGATALAGLWTALWGQFVHGQDAVLLTAVMYLSMTIVLLAYAGVMQVPLRAGRPSVWLYLALIGICETGAYLAVTWGYAATTHLSIVALVSGAFSLPTIILARVLLRERTTWLQGGASLLIVLGIVLVSVR